MGHTAVVSTVVEDVGHTFVLEDRHVVADALMVDDKLLVLVVVVVVADR